MMHTLIVALLVSTRDGRRVFGREFLAGTAGGVSTANSTDETCLLISSADNTNLEKVAPHTQLVTSPGTEPVMAQLDEYDNWMFDFTDEEWEACNACAVPDWDSYGRAFD